MRKINIWLSVLTIALFVGAIPALGAGTEGSAAASAPNNTARNVRDRGRDAQTPTAQSESKTDIDLAAAIRRAIEKDDRLSTTAKNIKIITGDGRVVLRGPVATSHEKMLIAHKARAIAGTGNVINQLDVENSNNRLQER